MSILQEARAMRTPQLEAFYKERIGEPPICT